MRKIPGVLDSASQLQFDMKTATRLVIAFAALSFAMVSCTKSEVIAPQDSDSIEKTKVEWTHTHGDTSTEAGG